MTKIRFLVYNNNNNASQSIKYFLNKTFLPRMQQLLVNSEANAVTDDSEISSVCEDSRSETSTDVNAARGDVHPISYGTNWMPPPNFSMFKEAQRKISLKSFHTVTGVNDVQVIMKKKKKFLFNHIIIFFFFSKFD